MNKAGPEPESGQINRGQKMEEWIMLGALLNVFLLAIAYLSGSRAIVLVSSIIWILIGFALYGEYEQILLLALSYMIAFGQFFIPVKGIRK